MGRKMTLLVVMLVTLLFVVGCSKISKENYDKLEMGMEYYEVTALLGSPDNCAESMGVKSCTWGNEAKNIKVNFLGDKAVVFSCNGVK